MKNFFRLLLVAGLIAAGWMNRDKLTGLRGEPTTSPADESATETGPSAPASAPPPTPHPAKEAQATAAQVYPALKMPDSAFHKKFVALYAEAQRNEPVLLARPDWPIKLAERTAIALGGGVMPLPTTPGPAKPRVLQGSALDQKPKGHP